MQSVCIACDGQGCSLCGESVCWDARCTPLAHFWDLEVTESDLTRAVLWSCYVNAAFCSNGSQYSEVYGDIITRKRSVSDDSVHTPHFGTMPRSRSATICKACDGMGCGLCKSSNVQALPVGDGDCAICLGTGEDLPVRLHCEHDFCPSCLSKHVASQLRARRSPWCPLCRENLHDTEIEAICPEEFSQMAERGDAGDVEEVVPPPRSRRAERIFRRTARKQHLKKCPSCQSPIQKNGGCDHMNCTCGHRFNWSEAPTVVPCHRVHFDPKRSVPIWCRTCSNCSPIATAKLAGVRAGVVVAVPVGAAVATGLVVAGAATLAAGTALTAAVPAVVCAPMAAAYEPVRRVRGRDKRNPFVRGMGSGVRALKRVTQRVAEAFCDSD